MEDEVAGGTGWGCSAVTHTQTQCQCCCHGDHPQSQASAQPQRSWEIKSGMLIKGALTKRKQCLNLQWIMSPNTPSTPTHCTTSWAASVAPPDPQTVAVATSSVTRGWDHTVLAQENISTQNSHYSSYKTCTTQTSPQGQGCLGTHHTLPRQPWTVLSKETKQLDS